MVLPGPTDTGREIAKRIKPDAATAFMKKAYLLRCAFFLRQPKVAKRDVDTMLEKIRDGSQGMIAKVILGFVILTFALAGVGSYLGNTSEVHSCCRSQRR